MLTPKVKSQIAEEVQNILQLVDDVELPEGEINFILHVDGAASWSWANIQNNGNIYKDVPEALVCNLTVK
jgi:hypothetical protein